jgi:hypothetical protein
LLPGPNRRRVLYGATSQSQCTAESLPNLFGSEQATETKERIVHRYENCGMIITIVLPITKDK